jgi:hypothetical protein
MESFRSDISNVEFPVKEKISAKTIRHSILSLIQKDYPQFSHESFLSRTELNEYKERAIKDYLVK